jgi:xanthosine utilization system XapX-like protein
MKDDRLKLLLVRVTLPVAVFVVGVIRVIVGDEVVQGAGSFLIGSAVLGALANAYMRLALQSNADREREEARRVFFDKHGRWPRRDEELDRPPV